MVQEADLDDIQTMSEPQMKEEIRRLRNRVDQLQVTLGTESMEYSSALPEMVKVGYLNYVVKCDDPVLKNRLRYGEHIRDPVPILSVAVQDNAAPERTLFEEIVHAVEGELKQDIINEEWHSAFCGVLYTVLKDNGFLKISQ